MNSRLENPGLTGCLIDVEEDEILPGDNDSVIESFRVGVQWLMLGPISFINESRRPHVAYVNVKNWMVFVTLREKKRRRIAYHIVSKPCIGLNNEFCLSSEKSLHGSLFQELVVKLLIK